MQLFPETLYPFLSGDAATRIENAQYIVGFNPYRAWLPVTQLPLPLLHAMHAPISAYGFISIFYTLIFIFGSGFLFQKFFNPGLPESLFFAIFILFFCSIDTIQTLSTQLYQEMPSLGILTILLLLSRNPRLQKFVWGVGMLTRESFWIYWFVYLAFCFWSYPLRKNCTVSNAILSSIPFLWGIYSKKDLIPEISIGRQYVTADVYMHRVGRLLTVSAEHSLTYLLTVSLCLLCVACVCRSKTGKIEKQVSILAIISTIFLYGYLISIDPFAVTPLNPRQLFPVLTIVPLAAGIAASKNVFPHRTLRNFVMVIFLCACYPAARFNFNLQSVSERKELYESANHIIQTLPNQERELLCFENIDYWSEYKRIFVPIFLYSEKRFLKEGDRSGEGCTVIFGRKDDACKSQGVLLGSQDIRSIPYCIL